MFDLNRESCVVLITAFAHFLWQATLVGGIFYSAMHAFRRSATARYWTGMACLLILGVCVPATCFFIHSNQKPSDLSASTTAARVKDLAIGSPTTPDVQPLRPTVQPPFSVQSESATYSSSSSVNYLWFTNNAAPSIFYFYIAGVIFFASRLAMGVYASHSFERDAIDVTEPHVIRLIARATKRVGLSTQPAVKWCKFVAVPSVVGIFRPTILLPLSCATGLSAGQLENILLHELTHIRRFDPFMNLLQNTIEAALFFHPVVWLISRRVRLEREFCCDSAVTTELGSNVQNYVLSLLEVAQLSKSTIDKKQLSLAAVGSSSQLGQRIDALLDRSIPRSSRSSRWHEAGSLISIVAVLTICCLFTTANLAVAAVENEDDTISSPVEAKQPAPAAENEVVGIVTDTDGKPLEEVLVDAWTWVPGSETKTDKFGAFRLDPQSDQRENAEIRFSKPGYSPHYIVQQQLGAPNLHIELDSTTYIEGQLTNTRGRPVAEAKIIGEQGQKQGDGVVISGVTTETTTDKNGNYRMYVFPDTYEMQVTVPGAGATRVPDIVVEEGQAKSLDIQLQEAVQFRANVVDAISKKPVKDVVLWAWRTPGLVGQSDKQGKIQIDGLLPGNFEFSVGSAPMKKYHGMDVYFHGNLGRWWSPAAQTQFGREEHPQPNQFQRNLDGLTFDLSVDMEPVTIFVEQGVVFEGKVFDPDGKPVAGATVAPAKTGSGNSLTGDTRYSEETKADGSYRVVMPAGKDFQYNLIVHDGKYQEWRNWANGVTEPFVSIPGQKFENFDLTLNRPCTVKGKVIPLGNEDVDGIQVRAHAFDKRGNRYYDPTVATTKKDGTFELRFIRPGKHYIQMAPFWLHAEDAPSKATILLDLKPGETREGIEFMNRVIPPPGNNGFIRIQ